MEFNQALKETGIAAEVVHVSDIAAIMNQGIIFTAALAVDGETKVSGRVPSVKELNEIFAEEVTMAETSCIPGEGKRTVIYGCAGASAPGVW